jgi:ADP-ribose pyrophosphatase YjhB (NUDIX family)
MSRPNKCIKDENGNEQWISRSTVVIPVVFRLDEKTGDIYTLVEKRGPAVSHPGEWCCPCGYLDWDETLQEACQREVREETGLELNLENILFFTVDSNPKTSNQSVDLWYSCWAIDKDFDLSKIETTDEILDLKWMKVAKVYYKWELFTRTVYMDIYKKSIYNCYGTWAFKTHKDKIIEMLKTTVKSGKVFELDE